jgi:hypothetical protein
MNTYTVVLRIYELIDIEVEAASREDAEAKAEELINDPRNDSKWIKMVQEQWHDQPCNIDIEDIRKD